MSTHQHAHLKYDEAKLRKKLASVGIARESTIPAKLQIAVPSYGAFRFSTAEEAAAFIDSLLAPVGSSLAGICGEYGIHIEERRVHVFVRTIFDRFSSSRKQAIAQKLFDLTTGRTLSIETANIGHLSALELETGRFVVDAGVIRAIEDPVSVEILLATLIGRGFFGVACGITEEEPLNIADAENTLALFDRIEQTGENATPYFQAIFKTLHSVRLRETATSFSYIDCLQANVKKKEYAVPDLIGGRYKPLAVLGEGGMGIVFLAKNQETGSKVAVKIMRGTDEELARFIREVRLIKDVNHPYVISIESFNSYGDVDNRHAYYAMRYCPWPTLKQIVDEGIGRPNQEGEPPSVHRRNPGKFTMIEYIRMICEALLGIEAIHRHQLVHRDIKPDNIKYDPETRTPIIFDFGLVKSLKAFDGSVTVSGLNLAEMAAEEPHSLRTMQGSMMGTPGYMSPEQTDNSADVDTRADIFSAGAMLYEMMTGAMPFDGENVHVILSNTLSGQLVPPSQLNPAIDPQLEAIICKAMAFNPAERHQSAQELREDLQRYVAQAEKPKTVGIAIRQSPKAQVVVKKRAGDHAPIPTVIPVATVVPRTVQPAAVPIPMAVPVAAPAPEPELEQVYAAPIPATPSTPAAWHRYIPIIVTACLVLLVVMAAAIISCSRRPPALPAPMTVGIQPRTVQIQTAWPFDAAAAKRRQTETAAAISMPVERTIAIAGVKMQMMLIPAGEFVMGGKDSVDELVRRGGGDREWWEREQGRHKVRISRPFYLARHEVPQALWDKVMGANPAVNKDTAYPVENVSWEECQAFIGRLNAALSSRAAAPGVRPVPLAVFRLPTEAEWEWACRAGTENSFYCGEALAANQANFNGSMPWDGTRVGTSLGRITSAGNYALNPWGLADMYGNVWEWCQDWFGPYAKDLALTDPQGPPTGALKVLRGGSFMDGPSGCRSAVRNALPARSRYANCGLRLALTIPVSSQAASAGGRP